MPREFVLPDLGEGIHEAQIVRVLIQPGQVIVEDQYLMEVETDKAAVEIPSPFAGIAKMVHVKEGQTINVGAVIVTFDDAVAAQVDARPKPVAAANAIPAPTPPVAPSAVRASSPPGAVRELAEGSNPAEALVVRSTAAAAPAVRKLAREMGLNLDAISGTGPGGRVTREDVQRSTHAASAPVGRAAASMASSMSPVPNLRREASPPVAPLPGVVESDKWGTIRKVPLTLIRKTIAAQMTRSVYTIPHVTHGDEADITELERLRRQLNESTGGEPKITPMAFLIRALCIALRKYPIMNSSYDDQGGQSIFKDYINLGIAVDTERGLIVPVIRDADRLTLRGIATALRTISERVRTNQFAVEDLRGGTFTITNVGALGGTFSTPIINFPEVAILGLGRSRNVPVLREGQLAEARMLPLALSFDHRATDGANAARFTREIIGYLESPARFMLD